MAQMNVVETLLSEYAADCVLQLSDLLDFFLFMVVVVVAQELWPKPTHTESSLKTLRRFFLILLLMYSSEFIRIGKALIKQSVERQIRAQAERLGNPLRIESPRSPHLPNPQP
jgi:hypothetical protein